MSDESNNKMNPNNNENNALADFFRGVERAIEAAQNEAKSEQGIEEAPALPAAEDQAQAGTETGSATQAAKGPAFPDRMGFDDVVGYDDAIEQLKRYGIGLRGDAAFAELVATLNERHGYDGILNASTYLFSSPAREDAGYLMMATLGEIDLPAMRLSVEEGVQGMAVLTVTTQATEKQPLGIGKNNFNGGAVVLLENIDTWGIPFIEEIFEGVGDMGPMESFMVGSFSRGAREALNLIRCAVEHPEVYVLASVSSTGELSPFIREFLEPMVVIEIDLPTDEERALIWKSMVARHPSLEGIDIDELVRYSANLPRYDIYIATQEAIEVAYKRGLADRRYYPVTSADVFEKLAAFQSLDSKEYEQLEEAVLEGFRKSLDDIDGLLGSK